MNNIRKWDQSEHKDLFKYLLADEVYHQQQEKLTEIYNLSEEKKLKHIMNKNWRNVITDAAVITGKDFDGDIITIQGYTFITNLNDGIIIRPSEEISNPLPEKAFMLRCKEDGTKNHAIIFANSEEEAIDICIENDIKIYDNDVVLEIADNRARLISKKTDKPHLFIQ